MWISKSSGKTTTTTRLADQHKRVAYVKEGLDVGSALFRIYHELDFSMDWHSHRPRPTSFSFHMPFNQKWSDDKLGRRSLFLKWYDWNNILILIRIWFYKNESIHWNWTRKWLENSQLLSDSKSWSVNSFKKYEMMRYELNNGTIRSSGAINRLDRWRLGSG